MRIGRGYSQQSFTVAGKAFGPRSPILPPPVVTTISVTLASGLATNQRRAQMRFPRQGWEPGITQTTEALPQTWGNPSRRNGPAPPELIGSIPQAPVVTTLSVTFAQAVQRAGRTVRPTIATLPGPTVLAAPEEPSQRVQTIQAFSVFARPPHIRSALAAPAVVGTPAFVAPPIQVTLQENRDHGLGRRHFPVSFLFQPQTLQTFASGRPVLARVRPRPTRSVLPETIVAATAASFTAEPISVSLARIRPRATSRALFPPTVLRVFQGSTVVRVRTRPRPTGHALGAPTVMRVPSVEQAERTIRVSLARIRPRPTAARIDPPTQLQVFDAAAVTLAHARPRPTTNRLAPPTALQTFQSARAPLARTRPRPTIARLGEPTVVRVPSVEQQEDTVRVALTRIRPRPTIRIVSPPTALAVFAGPRVFTTKTRPRATTHELSPPAVVVPPPTLRMQTVAVWLAGRTRLDLIRHAPHSRLRPPTVVVISPPVVTDIAVSLAEPRNRRDLPRRFPLQGFRQRVVRETGSTVTYQQRDPLLGPRPPQVIDPLPSQRVETIETIEVAVSTRREFGRRQPLQGHGGQTIRETGQGVGIIQAAFRRVVGPKPPTIIGPLPTPQQQTITVRTALRRQIEAPRRAPDYTLRPPTIVNAAFVAPPVDVTLAAVRTRRETQRLRTTYDLFSPAAVAAGPTLKQQTIAVALVRARPRPTAKAIGEPQAVSIPSVEQTLRTIRTSLARIRPRPTAKSLRRPTALRTFAAGAAALARIRPRKTVYALRPPTALRVPQVEQAEDTIRVVLTRARPRPTTIALRRPVAVHVFAARKATTSLVVTRPARTSSRLAPPATLQVTARPLQAELAPARRPIVQSRLAPPAVIAPAVPVSLTLTVWLVAVKARLLHLPVKHIQPQIIPVIIPRPGWTDTRTNAAAAAAGTTVAPNAAEGGTAAIAAAEGRDSPDAATTIGTVKTDAAEISDKRSGT